MFKALKIPVSTEILVMRSWLTEAGVFLFSSQKAPLDILVRPGHLHPAGPRAHTFSETLESRSRPTVSAVIGMLNWISLFLVYAIPAFGHRPALGDELG